MRRLPVYLLLDTSGSMRGEPIEAVNHGLETLVSAMRRDPYALETVHVSILTFDQDVKVVAPMTSLEDLVTPRITTPDSGPTHLGRALEVLTDLYRKDVVAGASDKKGDWAPYLFVMTDGKPSDIQLYKEMCLQVRRLGFANIIGCAAGPKARREDLEPLCDHVAALDTMDSASFTALFKWISDILAQGNRSLGVRDEGKLPPPPGEIVIR